MFPHVSSTDVPELRASVQTGPSPRGAGIVATAPGDVRRGRRDLCLGCDRSIDRNGRRGVMREVRHEERTADG